MPGKNLRLLKANVELSAARAKWRAAKSELRNADEIATGLPPGNPDGTHALGRATTSLSKAGEELQAALEKYIKATDTAGE